VATCEIEGRTIGLDRTGAGPPLVVVNGYAATRADWDPTFIARLADGHELILLDNRGMGESSNDGAGFAMEDLAGDVAAVIDRLGLERPAVLGWSLGGCVAQALSLSHPGSVGALVLLSTTPGGEPATRADEDVKARLLDLSGPPREQATRMISLLFTAERAAEIASRFGDVVAAAREALPHDVAEHQAEAMEAWEAEGAGARLGEIKAPALVATGSEDVVFPPANALALAAGIDGAWLARFPNSGHAFMADHPEPLATLIATFLSAIAER
jgi:pimeloyl-ACP methyl ester carboxylesterase